MQQGAGYWCGRNVWHERHNRDHWCGHWHGATGRRCGRKRNDRVGDIEVSIIGRAECTAVACYLVFLFVQAIFKCPTAGYFQMSRFNAVGLPLT